MVDLNRHRYTNRMNIGSHKVKNHRKQVAKAKVSKSSRVTELNDCYFCFALGRIQCIFYKLEIICVYLLLNLKLGCSYEPYYPNHTVIKAY